ncbi:MAG: amidase family protein [Planctomycetia bacterium]|nr:amidase family protein [Planctomycetia bacterium]
MFAQRLLLCVVLLLVPSAARAEIYRWDNGEVIPGTEGITLGPGVQLDHLELTFAELNGDLTNANFSGSNLADASICCSLQDADFSGTIIRGAILYGVQREQLYSTQSYLERDLRGVFFIGVDLTGWDLSHQNLSNSVLRGANFTNMAMVNADLTGADLRKSLGTLNPSVNLRNAIQADSEIHGLNLLAGETLTLLTSDLCAMECESVGVEVSQSFVVAEGAQLEVLIQQGKAFGFHKPIQVHDLTSVTLGGTLNIVGNKWGHREQLYGTFDLFDWPNPLDGSNRFDAVVAPPGMFVDSSQLYSTGEVTLTAVPEPHAAWLMIVMATLLIGPRVARRLSTKTWSGVVALGALSWQSPARCETFTLSESTVVDINHAFDSGVLTSEKLVQLYLNRIAAFDDGGPALNSMIALNPAALETARALDAERRASGPRSPLHGVPIVLKDNVDTFDMPTTFGCLALEGSIPPDDAFLVRRLREAGAIILGKNNLDEFGVALNGRSSLGGQTRDAYDPNRVPLGSSGGTGVAVAANFAALGIGADAIGSVRMPSSASSLVGLKPTLGLISRDGPMAYDVTREMAGPMARTVTDVAITLDVIAGYDPADPTTVLSQGHIPASYLDSLQIGRLQQAKFGKVPYSAVGRTNTMRDLAEAAYQELQGLGAELTRPVDVTFMPDWYSTLFDSVEYDWNRYLESLGPGAPVNSLDELIASGEYMPSLDGYFATVIRGDTPYLDDPAFIQLLSQRDSLRQQLIGIMNSQGLDALVYPTFPQAPALTTVEERVWTQDHFDNMTLAAFLGLPAITVPAGFTPDGLPLGIEFLGRPFSEPELLSFAYDYEQATLHRLPPASTPPLPGETVPEPNSAYLALSLTILLVCHVRRSQNA